MTGNTVASGTWNGVSRLRMLPCRDMPGAHTTLSVYRSAGLGCCLACIAASCIASLTSALSLSSDRRHRLSRHVGSCSSSPAHKHQDSFSN